MNVQEATTRWLPDLKERHLPENCRETINTILKETYGYEQFRNLEIYDDLSKGKEKLLHFAGTADRERYTGG